MEIRANLCALCYFFTNFAEIDVIFACMSYIGVPCSGKAICHVSGPLFCIFTLTVDTFLLCLV